MPGAVTLYLTDKECEALADLSNQMDLPQDRVLIQALRHYQMARNPPPDIPKCQQPDSPDLDLPIDETFLVNTGAELYFDHGSKAIYRYQLSDSMVLEIKLDHAKTTVDVSLQGDVEDCYARLPHVKTSRQLLKLVEALGGGEGK